MSRSRKGIRKMDSNISFNTKQEGWKNVKSNDDLLGIGSEVQSTLDKISADIAKIVTMVQKQDQRIESLEKTKKITPNI